MAISSEVRRQEIEKICLWIDEKYNSSIHEGVLLCEGDRNSIDVKLYSKVYPYLLVVPAGGCTDIEKLISGVRRKNPTLKIFGLIDRDAHSKRELRKLQQGKKIYSTKLPFIENVICTPEVIKIICQYLNLDYKKIIKEINEGVLKALTNKIKNSLPVNVSISADDLIESISFSIKLKTGAVVEKTINERSSLYSYRDKTIANLVAEAFDLNGRQGYYQFIEKLLKKPEVEHDLLKAVRAYLPMIKV